jgi:molybdate transport system regulatory protein
MEIKAKLWLEEDGRMVLGSGRAELLRHIRETGSISKAAKAMEMSYSHAWSQVRSISEAVGGQVVETSRGGMAGGRSRLTPLGQEILKRFEMEMERLDRHLAGRNR